MALKLLPAEAKTSREEMMRRCVAAGFPREHAGRVIEEVYKGELFLSECGTYQVSVNRNTPNGFDTEMTCLSIKRVDKEPLQDWRVLQEIKNAIMGNECEAIELFPAESRLVDTANQRWLWCFDDPRVRVPVGFTDRAVQNDAAPMEGVKQRPRV